MAVIVLILLSMVGVAIVAASQRERSANRTRADRMAGQGPVDVALSQYRFGLQSGKISARSSWVPDQAGLTEILTRSGGFTGRAIPNSQVRVYSKVDEASVPVTARYTAEVDGATDDGLHQYWQVLKVEQPNVGNGNQLIVTIRAWVAAKADSSDVTAARIIRATFRQGRFSDYQLLTNGPIRLEDGVTIRGPIHSNGATDSRMTLPSPDVRIFADAGARVVCPAADVDVSTAFGQIRIPTCPRYDNQAPDENFVSFQGLTRTFSDMKALCNASVQCFTDNNVHKGPYTVVLRGDGRTDVLDQTTGLQRTLTNIPNGGFLFNNSISVRGTATQRMTLAAFSNDRLDIAAPSITIVNNTQPSAGMSLGLFAQGDVIVNPRRTYPTDPGAACTTNINAVMIAQTGSLSIGRQNMSDIAPATQPQPCGRITMRGAIASTNSPVLSYRWPNRNWLLGFTERIYEWDVSFRDNPPPFTPGTDRWDVTTYADADQSTLVSGVAPN